MPQIGYLNQLSQQSETVKGAIKIKINRDETTFKLTLNSPEKTKALVGIPKDAIGPIKTITINGKTAWSNGNPNPTSPALSMQATTITSTNSRSIPATGAFKQPNNSVELPFFQWEDIQHIYSAPLPTGYSHVIITHLQDIKNYRP